LFVGLADLSVTSRTQTVNCGGAFDDLAHGDAAWVDNDNRMKSRMSSMYEETHFTDLCESKKGTYQILAGAAGVIGLGLVIGGVFIPGRKPEGASA